MTRQPHLDATPTRCIYAAHPTQRPHCHITAVVRYADTALCADCDTRRSTLGKATTPHRLPDNGPIDPITWLTNANRQLHQAHTELAAAARHARTHGHTWTTIGATLNITKQAAQQRFSKDHPTRG